MKIINELENSYRVDQVKKAIGSLKDKDVISVKFKGDGESKWLSFKVETIKKLLTLK